MPGAAAMSMTSSPFPRRKYMRTRAAALPTGCLLYTSLLFNGSLMVRSGLGYALCFDHIAPSGKDSPFACLLYTSRCV